MGGLRSVIAWKIKYCTIFSLLLIYYLPSQRTHYCPLLCELHKIFAFIHVWILAPFPVVRALFDFSLKLLTHIEFIINSIFILQENQKEPEHDVSRQLCDD